MKEYSILISQTAYFQIVDAVQFVNNVSPDAAKDLYNDIMSSINSLKEMPERCPVVDYLKLPTGETRKLLLCKGRYVILFSIVKDKVNINYFIDTRKEHYFL